MRIFTFIIGLTLSATAQTLPPPPFLCPSTEDCTPALALVSAGDDLCLGFLGEDGFIYTNSHCLPEELRQAGASCEGTVQIRLVGEGGVATGSYPSVSVPCLSVDMATVVPELPPGAPFEVIHMDLARLRVQAPDQRPGLAISPQGLPNSADFSVPQIRRRVGADGRLMYSYEMRHCEAVQHSLTLPSFAHNHAPLGLLGNCPMEYGDSGAPVIDAAGAVHGLNSATFYFPHWGSGQTLSGYELPLDAGKMFDKESTPVPMAWVTNLACLSRGTCLRSTAQLVALERAALAAMASQIERQERRSTISLDAYRRLQFDTRD